MSLASAVPPSASLPRYRATTSSLSGPSCETSPAHVPAGAGAGPHVPHETPAGLVNDKRIHRLWREEGLRVPYRKHKRPLRGIGVAVGAMCPIAPNVVWALDFQFDQTSDGRILKLLNVIDEYSRECLAIDVARSIDADGVVRCLDRLAASAEHRDYVRFDHGPEFIAFAVATWCRFNGTDTVFIDPGSLGKTPGSSRSTDGCATSI